MSLASSLPSDASDQSRIIAEQERALERLQATNERLQLALAASGVVGLWDWMVDSDLLHGDDNFARLYGLDPAHTAAGLTMEEYQRFVVPEDIPALRRDIRDTFERGADFLVEYRLAIPGQPLRWVECKGRLIQDAGGRPVRFSGTAVDITTRKEADEAVRASALLAHEHAERVQLALAAGAIIGTWVWEIQQDLFAVDEGFAVAFGLDPALGRKGLRLAQVVATVHPDDQAGLADAVASAVERCGPYVHQYRVRRGDGKYYWVEANGRVERGADGLPQRFPGVLIDVTERRAVEGERDRIADELRNLNATLEQRVAERTAERDRMWETSPDLLLIIDFNGIFRRVNPAWTKLLGYLPEELVGRHVNEFVLAEHHAQTVNAYETAAAGGLPRVENCYRHKDGGTRWISWVAAPAGNVTYATGRDITDEKARAAALDETREALRQSQKMEAVGQLTGGLAHDFNNLLAGISGSLDLLNLRMQQGQFTGIERYLLIAQSGVKRAAALTHRLLSFSRRQTLDPRPADVNRLVADMVELIQRSVGPGIVVDVVSAPGLWPVLVDASQLENALLNLCINARDAMPGGGRITIETANSCLDERGSRLHDLPPGDYLSLCVTDTGTGIPPELQEKIFEPFFTTKALGEGTGLGLSMVYGFAKQSGGQVWVSSRPGEGTTLCIHLPRYHGAVEDETGATGLALRPGAARRHTVLVVDDEPMIRMLLQETLDDLGYQTLEAADGATGLAILQSDANIDLLISDVGLPGALNGRQMADAARGARPGLKVLFITGYAENAALGNGQLPHGMYVMRKPFDLHVLADRIALIMNDRS